MTTFGASSSSLRPFLFGVGTTLVAVWLVQIHQKRRKRRKERNLNDSTSSVTSTQQPAPCWDAPDLDLRMIRKAEAAIQLRCSRITVVVERCTNDYNYSAILRTVEALGLQHVWIIEPPTPSSSSSATTYNDNENEDDDNDAHDGDDEFCKDEKFRSPGTGKIIKAPSARDVQGRALHHLFAKKAMEWLSVKEFETTQDCLNELRRTNHTIWATDLSQQAICLTRDALQHHYQQQRTISISSSFLPQQLAIVFGTEAVGCSAEMLKAADLRVYLPLRGFADSLNLSVATALVLHQLFQLDPTLVGAMPETERRQLRQAWFAKLCRQRLLTPAQKRQRYKLLQKIKKCEEIQLKQQQPGHELQESQQVKLNNLPELQRELDELDRKNRLIDAAIAEFVDHPPPPLTDMRRADDHRVCFVGKNTKRRHVTDWQDMPATSNNHTLPNATASFFRQRILQLDRQSNT